MGMIDVGKKRITRREASAHAFIKLDIEIIRRIKNNNMPKGNVLEDARVAGIMAAKKTPELIPLCHNIGIECAGVDFKIVREGIIVESLIKSTGKTGVEMEALVCCSIAALTIYDMCKMFSKSIEIQNVYLLEKKGGRSGHWQRESIL